MLCVIRNGDRHTSYLNRLDNSLHFILSFLLAGLQGSGHSLIFGERAVVRFIVTSLSVQLPHNQWTGSLTGLGRQICCLPSRMEALRGVPCRSRSLAEACFAGPIRTRTLYPGDRYEEIGGSCGQGAIGQFHDAMRAVLFVNKRGTCRKSCEVLLVSRLRAGLLFSNCQSQDDHLAAHHPIALGPPQDRTWPASR